MTPNPQSEPSLVRRVLTIIALIILAGIVIWQLWGLRDPKVFPPDDFVEYWAAGRLNLDGKNPYDADLLKPLEEQAGRKEDFGVMMWNPPWTLTFVMPLGAIHPFDAKVIWLSQNFILVILCADWLWRIYGGDRKLRWVSWLLALTFLPTILVLGAGQIGPLILLGITLFLFLEKAGLPWLAGSAGVLMAIKPHLVYLFWPTLAALSLFRGWKIVGGGIITGIVCTLIPMAFNPDVLRQFWIELTQRPPAQWISPTLGTVLRIIEAKARGISEMEAFSLQFLPGLLGMLWLLWYGWTTRREPWVWRDRLPLVLLVSFVTASYGAWPFDLVILLPAVIQVASRLTRSANPQAIRWGIAAWVALNLPALVLNLFQAYSFWYIWMAPSMLLLYLLLKRIESAPEPAQ